MEENKLNLTPNNEYFNISKLDMCKNYDTSSSVDTSNEISSQESTSHEQESTLHREDSSSHEESTSNEKESTLHKEDESSPKENENEKDIENDKYSVLVDEKFLYTDELKQCKEYINKIIDEMIFLYSFDYNCYTQQLNQDTTLIVGKYKNFIVNYDKTLCKIKLTKTVIKDKIV